MRKCLLTVAVPVTIGLAGLLATFTLTGVAAPPFGRGPGNETTMHGKIGEFSKNDRGDVDGIVLDNGTQLHFPPHMGSQVTEKLRVGDRVDVDGRPETRPDGSRVFEARLISSGKLQVRMDPPRRRGKEPESPMEAHGKVDRFVTNPHDDVDGFVLADGTEVRVPPHQGDELQGLIREGDEVQIAGRSHTTPHGEVHLHADRIQALGSDRVFERDAPPAGRPGPKPGPRGDRARDGDEPSVSNAELLKELQQIRRLLETMR